MPQVRRRERNWETEVSSEADIYSWGSEAVGMRVQQGVAVVGQVRVEQAPVEQVPVEQVPAE